MENDAPYMDIIVLLKITLAICIIGIRRIIHKQHGYNLISMGLKM